MIWSGCLLREFELMIELMGSKGGETRILMVIPVEWS
jgi:hypothetical protein